MRHLSDGTLRRMQDEPLSTTGAEKDHYQECSACRDRAMAIAAEAERAGMLMAVPDSGVDTQAALLRLRRSADGSKAYRRTPWNRLVAVFGSGGSRAARPAAALALATAMMVALVATGVAENFVKVFEPQQFQAVQVQPSDLKGLPDLSQFGDMKFTKQPKFTPAADAAAAQAASGLTLRAPSDGSVPDRAKGTPQYLTMSQVQASFTFSAAKAQAWAATNHKTLPAMPAGLDGSTLTVTAGPGIIAVYGASSDAVSRGAGVANNQGRGAATRAPASGAPAPANADPGAAKPGAAPNADPGASILGGGRIPTMAIVEMTTPVVSSNGASVTAIEDYLLSLPGFPSDLAAQIRAIGDPSTTLPIPVPTGQQSHQVDINGAKGLFVGDSTGLGSGVVWTKDSVLYATVGTMTESEVTGVARSLH